MADGKVVCGWLLDQNVPAEIYGWLASLKLGVEAYHARDLGLGRASDDEIFRAAQERDCTIAPSMRTLRIRGSSPSVCMRE